MSRLSRDRFADRQRAFTLIEVMVSTVLLAAILLMIFSITQQTANAWKGARFKVESFQAARLAFESLTRNLGQATLNTYYDFFDSAGLPAGDSSFNGVDHYGRQSDLHFLTGKSLAPGQVTHSLFFQTPAGYATAATFQNMETLLNACGYYVLHGQDSLRPAFLAKLPNAPANDVRYRLMQFLQPSEHLAVYASTTGKAWFTAPLGDSSPPVQQMAENVIALVVLPRMSAADAAASGVPLTSEYEYDSRLKSNSFTQLPAENQLPPVVEVVLVVIDEASAKRLGNREVAILATLFQDTSKLDSDIASLETELAREHLTYRIFRTTVALRNSKWSS